MKTQQTWSRSLRSRVAGTSSKNSDGSDRQRFAAKCKAGDSLYLMREPKNRLDPNAIGVFTAGGSQLGYLPPEISAQIAPDIDSGGSAQAHVVEVRGGTEDHPKRDVIISVVYGSRVQATSAPSKPVPHAATIPQHAWRVEGADKQTGNPVNLIITAPSQTAAEDWASEKGILWNCITRVDRQGRTWNKDRRIVLGIAAGFVAVLLALGLWAGGGSTFKAPAALNAQAVFDLASPAVIQIIVKDRRGTPIASGSGFVVSDDGLAITNLHVLSARGGHSFDVLFAEGHKRFSAELVSIDADRDLVAMKIEGRDFPHLRVAFDPPKPGGRAFALGSPSALMNTISEGLVSGVRSEGDLSLVQTTASIGPGSSGGPLLNDRGEVIGVNTMGLTTGQNLNFAVSSTDVQKLIATARTKLLKDSLDKLSN